MRKYFYIYKSEIMSNLQYVFDIFVGFIGYFIMLFILYNMYLYLYNGEEVIKGYTVVQSVWYVIFTEILWSCTEGRKFSKKIADDVKSGNITYNINKPYNYIGYALSSHLGSIFIKSIIYIVLAFIMGFIFLGTFPELNIINILAVILTGFLALLISNLIIICIGLLSFKLEDSSPAYWIYSKLILVFGTIFPIEYFPEFAGQILRYSPVYVTTYGPAKLFVDFSYEAFINIILSQLVYLIIVIIICTLMYKRGVKKLNVNGG